MENASYLLIHAVRKITKVFLEVSLNIQLNFYFLLFLTFFFLMFSFDPPENIKSLVLCFLGDENIKFGRKGLIFKNASIQTYLMASCIQTFMIFESILKWHDGHFWELSQNIFTPDKGGKFLQMNCSQLLHLITLLCYSVYSIQYTKICRSNLFPFVS